MENFGSITHWNSTHSHKCIGFPIQHAKLWLMSPIKGELWQWMVQPEVQRWQTHSLIGKIRQWNIYECYYLELNICCLAICHR